jgi:hypothetical protein
MFSQESVIVPIHHVRESNGQNLTHPAKKIHGSSDQY